MCSIKASDVCMCVDGDQSSSLFQSEAAAPQPSSTGLADLLMVDMTPSQPPASGMSLTLDRCHSRKYLTLK